MTQRAFSKVAPALWHSARYRGLSDQAKVYYLYLSSNGSHEHHTRQRKAGDR